MTNLELAAPRAGEVREDSSERIPLVDFLGIGVQKAGTTWLHRMLGAHPEIFVAQGDDKDLRFFSSFYDFGFRWYESYFSEAEPANKRGEISTSYFYCKDAPERVSRYNPEMRFILLLRNPVDRLISQHRHEIRIGHLTGDLSLEHGIENNPSYVEQSRYFTQLSRWLEHFPLSHFHIEVFEEVFRDPAAAIRDLYDFVGVNPEFVPQELYQKMNEGRIPRSWLVDKGVALAASSFRGLRLGWIVDGMKKAGLNKLIAAGNTRHDDAMDVSEVRREQLQSLFATENANLSRLLVRDLSIWNN